MPDADTDLKNRLEAALPEIEARYASLQKHAGQGDPPEATQMLDRLADKIGQLRRHRQELNGVTPQSRSEDQRQTDIQELEALKQEMDALLTEFEADWSDDAPQAGAAQ